MALLQESLSVAHRTGAIESRDLERVAVDTTVQEKVVAHPTDARLTHRAIDDLLQRRTKQIDLAIVARLAHGSPRQRLLAVEGITNRKNPESQNARNP